jgi:competence protein ComEA
MWQPPAWEIAVDPSSTTSTPWRVLEEPVVTQTGEAQGVPRAPSAAAPTWTSAMNRHQLLAIAGVGLAAVLGVAAFFLAASSGAGSVEVSARNHAGVGLAAAASESAQPSSAGGALVVEVSGAVVRPGVFTLPVGSRVNDAIGAAGGFGPRVDAARASRELNLAAVLKDGNRILVPSRDDPPATAVGSGRSGQAAMSDPPAGTARSSGPIDLNRATVAELDGLPGIGPVTAAKIIASRDQKPFGTIDELRTRKLVGQKVFDGLRGLITIG